LQAVFLFWEQTPSYFFPAPGALCGSAIRCFFFGRAIEDVILPFLSTLFNTGAQSLPSPFTTVPSRVSPFSKKRFSPLSPLFFENSYATSAFDNLLFFFVFWLGVCGKQPSCVLVLCMFFNDPLSAFPPLGVRGAFCFFLRRLFDQKS